MHANNDNIFPHVLIIGASGKTGQRVAHRLEQRQIAYRGVSRNTSPAFDWNLPEHWRVALKGIKTVYLTYSPDLAIPQAKEHIKAFCEAAISANVEHIILLSGRGEPAAQDCELVLQQSGLDWTIIRASWFLQNFTEGEFAPLVHAGEVALPAATTLEPFIDIDDIADIAVEAITSPQLRNQLFEVTGPELLQFPDVVNIINEITGQSIGFTPLKVDDFIEYLSQQGTPPEVYELLRYLFTEVLDGRNAHVTDGVQRALNRPATDIRTTLLRELKKNAA